MNISDLNLGDVAKITLTPGVSRRIDSMGGNVTAVIEGIRDCHDKPLQGGLLAPSQFLVTLKFKDNGKDNYANIYCKYITAIK